MYGNLTIDEIVRQCSKCALCIWNIEYISLFADNKKKEKEYIVQTENWKWNATDI